MSLYDTKLTKAERKALEKHIHDLADEIDVLRILIRREMDDEKAMDVEIIIEAAQAIAKLAAIRHKLQTKPDDTLQLALLKALNEMDAEADE